MILCISSGDKFYIEVTEACHNPLEYKKVGLCLLLYFTDTRLLILKSMTSSCD